MQASTFSLMFSHFEVTQSCSPGAFVVIFSTVAVNAIRWSVLSHLVQGCTPRPAPPRPRGKWLPRGAPAPKIFKNAPPRPTPKMPRGLTVTPPRPEHFLPGRECGRPNCHGSGGRRSHINQGRPYIAFQSKYLKDQRTKAASSSQGRPSRLQSWIFCSISAAKHQNLIRCEVGTKVNNFCRFGRNLRNHPLRYET